MSAPVEWPHDEYSTLAAKLAGACGTAAVRFIEARYTDPAERLKQVRKALDDLASQQAR